MYVCHSNQIRAKSIPNEIASSESASYGRKFASALRTAIFVFSIKQEEVFPFGVISPFLECI